MLQHCKLVQSHCLKNWKDTDEIDAMYHDAGCLGVSYGSVMGTFPVFSW